MGIDRELKGQELLFTAMIMLLGEEGVTFAITEAMLLFGELGFI